MKEYNSSLEALAFYDFLPSTKDSNISLYGLIEKRLSVPLVATGLAAIIAGCAGKTTMNYVGTARVFKNGSVELSQPTKNNKTKDGKVIIQKGPDEVATKSFFIIGEDQTFGRPTTSGIGYIDHNKKEIKIYSTAHQNGPGAEILKDFIRAAGNVGAAAARRPDKFTITGIGRGSATSEGGSANVICVGPEC